MRPLSVMLKSLLLSNSDKNFNIYVMNSSLSQQDFETVNEYLDCNRFKLLDIKINDALLDDAPITDRYPKEMYYRIFAARYLPQDMDKILYLDPD